MWILDIINNIISLFRKPKPHIIVGDLVGSADWETPVIEVGYEGWKKYISLPYRTQWAGTFDEENCATRAAIECIEMILNFYLMNNLFPDNVSKFLKTYYCNEQGYVKLSIRFNSKLNGTTIQGQSMQAVLDNLAKDGFVPEGVYPDPPAPFTWEQYYAPVPDGIQQYGELSTTFFKVIWDVLDSNGWNPPNTDTTLQVALRTSPIYFGGKIGNVDKNGVEQWQGIKMYEHCRVIYAEDRYQEVLDSYTNQDNPSFLRELDLSFPIPTAIIFNIKII